jgi:Asp-tRNA(Asn)/Glu-tRNA(Gln) amidotransferase A subunit family amidase
MTRNPAGTFPIGLSAQGLPIGIQVIGSQQDDLGVLQGIKNFENIMNFNIKAP